MRRRIDSPPSCLLRTSMSEALTPFALLSKPSQSTPSSKLLISSNPSEIISLYLIISFYSSFLTSSSSSYSSCYCSLLEEEVLSTWRTSETEMETSSGIILLVLDSSSSSASSTIFSGRLFFWVSRSRRTVESAFDAWVSLRDSYFQLSNAFWFLASNARISMWFPADSRQVIAFS